MERQGSSLRHGREGTVTPPVPLPSLVRATLTVMLGARLGWAPAGCGRPSLCSSGRRFVAGHLMGKKSTGDFPYVSEEENKTPFSALPENIKQLEDYLQWEEISKYLLRLLEGNENKSAHFLKGGLPWYTRNTWETDDDSSWKDMMDYLLQVVNMKESTPS
ncbi:gastrin-releasing peptide [Egretta garzetta]|uniref:gastrin-releasing peptide n=1 Tax=Egretta garzetta TaxID=188379 RepID=UPI00163D1A5F|nr:gastrin-releasing peptide [Egretta garzetta]